MRVVLSASNTLTGWLIRLGTRSQWNHCDVLFDDGVLIGSSGGYGVEKLTLEKRLYGQYNIVKYRIDEIHLPDEEAARLFAEAQVGKGYDYMAVFAFLMPWRAEWNVKRKWFCSECVVAVCSAGQALVTRASAWFIAPSYFDESPLFVTVAGPFDI